MDTRPDSPVATVYRVSRSTVESAGWEGAIDPEVAVAVDVFEGSRTLARAGEPISDRLVATAVAICSGRPRLTSAAAAMLAAVVLIVVALAILPQGLRGTGTELWAASAALRAAPNVHVVKYAPDRDTGERRPIQEIWLARRALRVLEKSGTGRRLYDLRENSKSVIPADSGEIQVSPLAEGEYEGVQRYLTDAAGISAELVEDGKVVRVAESDREDLVAYDVGLSPASTARHARRLRVLVEADTGRPRRIELFERFSDTPERHVTTTCIEYLTDEEMASTMDEVWEAGSSQGASRWLVPSLLRDARPRPTAGLVALARRLLQGR
jgi:hypothetical protein